jgi:hypothetical protein
VIFKLSAASLSLSSAGVCFSNVRTIYLKFYGALRFPLCFPLLFHHFNVAHMFVFQVLSSLYDHEPDIRNMVSLQTFSISSFILLIRSV